MSYVPSSGVVFFSIFDSANLNEIENNQRNSVCKYRWKRSGGTRLYTRTSKHMISIISFDSSDCGLLYGFYICYARTHAHTDSNQIWRHKATQCTHMWNANTYVWSRACTVHTRRPHTLTHTESDRWGNNKPFFVNICIRLNYLVRLCVCLPSYRSNGDEQRPKNHNEIEMNIHHSHKCERQ